MKQIGSILNQAHEFPFVDDSTFRIFKIDPVKGNWGSFWYLWKNRKQFLEDQGFLAFKYGDKWHLELKEDINKWKDIERKPSRKVLDLINKMVIIKEVKEKLLSYQVPHVQNAIYSLLKENVFLDASDTGTGKTYTAIATCKNQNFKPLITCPKALIPTWQRVCDYFEIEPLAISNYETITLGKMVVKRKSTRSKNGYMIEKKPCPFIEISLNPYHGMNHEPKYQYNFNLPERGILIVDEGHRCKYRTSRPGQLLMRAARQKIKTMILSATIAESIMTMIPLGMILGFFESPIDFYIGWARKHGCYKPEDYWTEEDEKSGRKKQKGWRFNGDISQLQRIHSNIYPIKGARMRTSLIKDFPETLITADTYRLDGKGLREINKLYDKILNSSPNALVLRVKARMDIEYYKVPILKELAINAIEEGNSVVIFCNYSKTIIELMKLLKTDCVIWGKVSGDLNEANRKKFHEDRSRIILCNVKAAKEGIDLHDINGKYPRVTFISPMDSAQVLIQCLGRVHRIKAKSKSVQKIVYVEGTIEEDVADNVRSKVTNIKALNDKDLGKGVLF